MKTLTNLQELPETLLALGKEADTSVALIPLAGPLAASDVVAIRHGARLCDVTVVVCLEAPLPENQQAIAAEAGAKVCCLPSQHKPATACKISLPDGADITYFSQTVLATMPSVICVAQENVRMQRAAKALEVTFPGLFETLIPETPASLLDDTHQHLTQTLLFAQTMLDQGERVVRTLLQQVVAALHAEKFDDIRHLALFDATTLAELTDQTTPEMFLFAEVGAGETVLRQSVSLKVYGF